MKKAMMILLVLLLLPGVLGHRYETSSFDYKDFNPEYKDFSSSFRKYQEVVDHNAYRRSYRIHDTYHEIKCEKGRKSSSSQNYQHYYEMYCKDQYEIENSFGVSERVKRMNAVDGYRRYNTITVRVI